MDGRPAWPGTCLPCTATTFLSPLLDPGTTQRTTTRTVHAACLGPKHRAARLYGDGAGDGGVEHPAQAGWRPLHRLHFEVGQQCLKVLGGIGPCLCVWCGGVALARICLAKEVQGMQPSVAGTPTVSIPNKPGRRQTGATIAAPSGHFASTAQPPQPTGSTHECRAHLLHQQVALALGQDSHGSLQQDGVAILLQREGGGGRRGHERFSWGGDGAARQTWETCVLGHDAPAGIGCRSWRRSSKRSVSLQLLPS